MERARVIVHMRVSIDGKIDGPFEQQEAAKPSSRYYSNELFKLSPANANGITTVKAYAAKGHPDLSQFDGSQLEYEDWVPQGFHAETYDISFDRHGRAGWERNYFEYGGKKSRAIEVLTKQASKAYLAFLRSMEIPYLICGERDLDLHEALVKLKRYFGLDAIALCGGATIDGAFLQAGLVDEISLVVAPFVSGDNATQSSFNTLGKFTDEQFEFKSATKLADGGVHLIFTKHD
ncbi:dihydrofolate reductase family protein [Limosilactobacillus coleohominis]|nr:dihydrofolate reductase family protein [Limosilactobacillus coleohominis]